MSGHLIGCAGALRTVPGTEGPDGAGGRPLPTSHKLALLAFADSADDITHIGFAGYDGVRKWAVCSRGRAAELIRDLVEWGLLRPHKRGHRGQRAEYVVFPNGCCDLHRKPVDETPPDVGQLAAAAGVSVDQARKMLEALSGQPVELAGVHDPADDGSPQEKASGRPDATGGTASDTPDPKSPDVHRTPTQPVDNAAKGPERVHESRSIAVAFTPSKQTPLTPASGGAGCAVHATPVPNRRCCGTTPRQLEAKAKAERGQRRRDDAIAAAAAERAKPRGPQPGSEPIKATVRAEIARGSAASPIATTSTSASTSTAATRRRPRRTEGTR